MFKVTFVTKPPYNAEVVETHKSEEDYRLRAYALGWTIKSVEEIGKMELLPPTTRYSFHGD